MWRNLSIVMAITFLDFLSVSIFYGTSIPLLLAPHSVFTDTVFAINKNLIFGFVLLLLPLGQFLASPWWGRMADRLGRKRILTTTLLLSAVGYALIALSIQTQTLTLFIVARLLTAFVAVNSAIGFASIADFSSGFRKARRFNAQFIVLSLGFIVGPYWIDFTTHNIVYANAYAYLAAAYAVVFILLLGFFIETRVEIAHAMRGMSHVFAIFKHPSLKKIFIVWMLFQLGWSLFFQYSGDFLYQSRHLNNEAINHLFSWLGVGALLSQLLLVQPLARWLTPRKVIAPAMLIVGGSLVLMGLTPINMVFYGLLGIYCLGIGFFLTYMNTHVSNLAAANEQAQAMTMLSSSQALMNIIVTFLGGFVMVQYPATPYVIGGAIILVAAMCWFKAKKSGS